MTSVNWNVVVSIQACSDYCVLQVSLSFSEAMQHLLLGEVHPLLPFWFLLCIRQKWDGVHNALLMVSLWAGQIPFVFQQTKRTLCSVFQLFSCGFIGQNIFITLCSYICLIYVNIKVGEILKKSSFTPSVACDSMTGHLHWWLLCSLQLYRFFLSGPFIFPCSKLVMCF